MTIGANRKLKQCDPYCKRKVVDEKEKRKDKPFKLKNDEKVPRSLRMVMQASQLVKEIDEKKQKREELYQENKEKNLQQNNGVSAKQIKKQEIKAKKQNPQDQDDKRQVDKKKQQKTEKKNQKVAKSVAGLDTSVAEAKKQSVEEMTDFSKQQEQLAHILGFMPNPEDKGENTSKLNSIKDVSNKKADIQLDTKRRPGENQEQYFQRMRNQINEKEKKMTNRYAKNKENSKLKKLKKTLKKKGLRLVDDSNNINHDEDDDEDEDGKDGKEGSVEKKEMGELDKKRKQQQLKHKNSKKDFNELQDNIKFGEQVDRPPTLPVVKDLSKRKAANETQSSKRKYLWQDEGEKKQEEETEEDLEEKRLQQQREVVKKQKLELLRGQVMQNYKQNKLVKKQRNAINLAQSENPKSREPRSFYL
ncbi:hypothetical protein DFA_01343 [Cavenderia fasciculata]|uniref:Uncharacterized protein n=1 Tax=Cavenderia fasciculata TaxID=261658 RepID=F4PS74_CACFS|nr:uncharacterized protein DFA_01343 [Cavenderia fasciculata]EGG21457.1 hypothetical protein DFA_01343 [Cavenderia fasciculata]|eukprot:XP_004359307.1 hypothetical protein DFA_01343 [Cavenderia fasciculata]